MKKNLSQRVDYYKRIVKPEVKRLRKHLHCSSNEMERRYYFDRLNVQISDFAKAMGIRTSILRMYV